MISRALCGRPSRIAVSWIGLGLCLSIACDSVEPLQATAPSVDAPPPGWSIAGQYHVTGVTVDDSEGTSRSINGTVVLVEEGNRYTTHFELATMFPGSDAVAAKVVGTGEGVISGWNLEGTADTQLVMASVPNVDVGFAFVPRQIGPRIVSSAKARFFEDGTVRIEIENKPVPGEDYKPTHTTLVGFRPSDSVRR